MGPIKTHRYEISVIVGAAITIVKGGADGFEANRLARIQAERDIIALGGRPIGGCEYCLATTQHQNKGN